MTRIYLDTSAYNRPFDDQTQPKIFLESQAVTLVLQMIEAKYFELISPSVLEYENMGVTISLLVTNGSLIAVRD